VASGREIGRFSRTGPVREAPFKDFPRLYAYADGTHRAVFGPGGDKVIAGASSADGLKEHVALMWDAAEQCCGALPVTPVGSMPWR
jgi:hypothetical protein